MSTILVKCSLSKQISKFFFQMSAQVHSVRSQAEGQAEGKAEGLFGMGKSIVVSYKLSLTWGRG